MATNTHHHGEHVVPIERQWMLRPGLVCGRPAIACCQPAKHPAGAASCPAAATSQATVAPAPSYCVAPVDTPQLASSSDIGAMCVVSPSSPTAILIVQPALMLSRPVASAFQAKMMAPTRSAAGLLSPTTKSAYPC